MSLHKDFEPIRGQLLNRSPAPSFDTAVNELVREEARLATLQAQDKLNVLPSFSLRFHFCSLFLHIVSLNG